MSELVDRQIRYLRNLLADHARQLSELKKKNVRVLSISPASTQTNMGKISTEQDFNTFLNPKEVAQYITHVISFDNEMIVDESRLNRITIK